MADPVRAEPGVPAIQPPPVVVKKYANRRLYNTESSSYITLDNLAEMVRLGRDFVVYDAKSGEDITRGVLTQIIVEEEGKGSALLPTGVLRQLIGCYGDSMQGLVPRYLEHAMTAFTRQQEQIRTAMQRTMGNLFPFPNMNMDEMTRQNIALMERAFNLFSPFYRPTEPPAGGAADEAAQEIALLRSEVERLRHELSLTQAVAGTPVVGTPVVGTPVVGTDAAPSRETEADGALPGVPPAVGTPALGSPVGGTPVVGSPAAKTAGGTLIGNPPADVTRTKPALAKT